MLEEERELVRGGRCQFICKPLENAHWLLYSDGHFNVEAILEMLSYFGFEQSLQVVAILLVLDVVVQVCNFGLWHGREESQHE